jgi:hypothetical protein
MRDGEVFIGFTIAIRVAFVIDFPFYFLALNFVALFLSTLSLPF